MLTLSRSNDVCSVMVTTRCTGVLESSSPLSPPKTSDTSGRTYFLCILSCFPPSFLPPPPPPCIRSGDDKTGKACSPKLEGPGRSWIVRGSEGLPGVDVHKARRQFSPIVRPDGKGTGIGLYMDGDPFHRVSFRGGCVAFVPDPGGVSRAQVYQRSTLSSNVLRGAKTISEVCETIFSFNSHSVLKSLAICGVIRTSLAETGTA